VSSKLWFIATLVVSTGVLLALTAGCGGSSTRPRTTATTEVSASRETSIADVFMTFEGRRYRLVGVQSSAAAVQGEAAPVGVTEDIDVDHEGPVQVYRATDGPAVHTFQPGDGGLAKRGVSLPDQCGRCGLRLDWAVVDAPSASD
jgi:hypothetical protein